MIKVVAAGVIGCDIDSFSEHLTMVDKIAGGDYSYHQAYQVSSKTWPTEMEYLNEKW